MQINARCEADVTPAQIMKRVNEGSGSKYSIHKETYEAERIRPLQSAYKKTEIPDIAALQRNPTKPEAAPKVKKRALHLQLWLRKHMDTLPMSFLQSNTYLAFHHSSTTLETSHSVRPPPLSPQRQSHFGTLLLHPHPLLLLPPHRHPWKDHGRPLSDRLTPHLPTLDSTRLFLPALCSHMANHLPPMSPR